jgi:pimeloyl-ACP methyl ester carboxylesterase
MNTTISADGTPIAFDQSGSGPPLVLVHGGLGDHTRWDALRPHLEPYVTVHSMDRRGRGGSGDSPNYDIEREYEDVAAVIDAVAEISGSNVDVYCSSFGGICAFGAATLTSNIRKLALYEGWPPVNPQALGAAEELMNRINALLAEDKREAALETAYLELVGLTQRELDTVREQPSWPNRIAAVHTLPREMLAFSKTTFDPEQAAKITAPTLLLVGEESPAWRPEAGTVAAALPDARINVLEGQTHVADLLAPEIVVQPLLTFLHERQ